MNICTIIAKNYVAHARVLAESFLEHHPGGTCSVLVIDDTEGFIDPAAEPFELVTPDELDIEDFGHMTAFYDVTELSTAVKPWFLHYLLNKRGMESIVYLDPDIRIFGPMDELEPLMREHELVLIPHATSPMPRDGKKPSEADILIAGTYNLGFMGLRAGERSNAMLDWWSERLHTDCVIAPERGYFVDQRWMDFVHGVMPGFYVLRDTTYNVAYWNLHSRKLTFDGEAYRVDGEPLRFFHFSGYSPDRRDSLSKHQTRIEIEDDPALQRICDEYGDALLAHGYEKAKNWAYTYDTLPGGLRFDRLMRRLYPEAKESGALEGSIFEPESARAFVEWLNRPAKIGAPTAVTRYLHELYSQRHDLRRAFPDLDGTDAPRFIDWARRHGAEQVPIPEQLLPPLQASPNGTAPQEAGDAPVPEDAGNLGVNVAGYFRSELGVGEAGRQVISALDALNVAVAPVGLSAPSSRQGHEFASFGVFEPPFPINLICVNADMLPLFAEDAGPQFFENRYSIGYWWWEVSEFPERFRGSFDHLDEIWVATQHIADAISRVSSVPVVKVTLPVSIPSVAKMGRAELGLPEDFVFLFVFDYNSVFERKNPLAAIEAFRSAFLPGSGASLVLKCINHEQHPDKHAQLLLAADSHPDVHVIDRYVSVKEKNAMIAGCDCYVSLHRSEGYGLTMAEAMYLGKPVIATGYSGNLDFMTPQNSYLVDYRLRPIGPDADPYPPTAEWAEPDVEDAARLMRRVFDQEEEARRRGARAARDIRRNHSPHAAGRKMVERLRQIEERSGGQLRTGPKTVKEAPILEAARTSRRVAAGPETPQGSRFGFFGRFARWATMRLVQPLVEHQKGIDEQIIQDVRKVNWGLREVARRSEVQGATAHAETLAQLRKQSAQINGLSGRVETLAAQPAQQTDPALVEEVKTLRARNEALETQMNDAASDLKKLRSRLEDLYPYVEATKTLMAESRAVPYVSGSSFESYKNPVWGLVRGYRRAEKTQNGHALHTGRAPHALVDIFRGSEPAVRDRQRLYLDLLASSTPVLVAACGRGELLDVLSEQGIDYLGIDPDPDMVEHCRAKGHKHVECADSISYLEGCTDESFGAIFCARLLQRLSHEALLRFLALSLRKLRPDGLLVVENLNPHVPVAMKAFLANPTEGFLIFPDVALALCEISGFASAFVFHPDGSGDVETDRFRESEYALVATKLEQE